MAIAASPRWPIGSWSKPGSRWPTISGSSVLCGRTACSSPRTPVEGRVGSTTAKSLSCARTCDGAQTDSRSPAGTVTWYAWPSSSMLTTARSLLGMRSPTPASAAARDMMLEAVESRFAVIQAPHALEWLTDNGSVYTAHETRAFATALNLVPCFTPMQSPRNNGISESFVKTFKRDYVRVNPLPDAITALRQIAG